MIDIAKPRDCPSCGMKRTRGLCAACRAAQREHDGRHSQHRCREITKSTQFRRLWENYCAVIYGAAPPAIPDCEWFFYAGATALLNALGELSAATPFQGDAETDEASSEELHRLINEIRSDFRRIGLKSASADPRRDRRPN